MPGGPLLGQASVGERVAFRCLGRLSQCEILLSWGSVFSIPPLTSGAPLTIRAEHAAFTTTVEYRPLQNSTSETGEVYQPWKELVGPIQGPSAPRILSLQARLIPLPRTGAKLGARGARGSGGTRNLGWT